MNNEAIKEQTQDLVARGKELVAEGNQRQLVFLGKTGKILFSTKLTIAVAVGAVLLITGFVSIPLIVIAGAIAMFMGLRVELRHNDAVELDS